MRNRPSEKIAENNNGKTIRRLAASSVKSSGLRNFFIIATIILSVSLLMVVSLFYVGLNTEQVRQVSKMQHVVYYGLDKEQLNNLAEDARTEYVLGMKRGQSVEIDGNMIQPVAYEATPLKDEDVRIDTVTPIAGREPENLNEVMLSDTHCEALGIKAEPGQQVTFTFLDGTTEIYTISGVFHLESVTSSYQIILSQKYAEEGSQLKEITYDGVVRIHDADKMNQSGFLDEIRSLASDCGIERKNVNENNYFLNTLSGGENQKNEMLLIVVVGAGILLAGVLVIYSVFYLAVVGRIQQFGQLRTIGMTQKQIKKMVRMEGLILSGIGIPIGLIIGGVVSYFIRPAGWSWVNTGLVTVVVVLADLLTILISIRKPAKIASSISPVEASKFSGVEDSGKNVLKESIKRYNRKITPASLAFMSRNRSKKKALMTTLSLGIGGVLYMTVAVLMTSTSLEDYTRQGEYRFGEFVIDLSYNVSETAEHGQTTIQMDNPIDETLIQQIEAIDGVKKVTVFQDADLVWSAQGEVEKDSMAPFTREEVEQMEPSLESGTIDYETMSETNQVLVQNNEGMKEVFGWGFEVGDEVELTWYDGEREREKTVTIGGILNTESFRKTSANSATFIIPEETLNKMMNGINLNYLLTVKVDREKETQIDKELNTLLKDRQALSMGTLKQRELEDKNSFEVMFAVMLGLSIFIVAFSILNMLNTLITNILTRKHEFAMLQSVGMTTKQLSHMIQMEGLLLVAGNLVITALLGSIVGYGIVKAIESMGLDYMHFTFPIWLYLAYVVFTTIVPVVVSTVMIRGFQKESLVDRLK